MRVFLLTIGLALIALGATILFGQPQDVIAGFEYWQQTGVTLVCAGSLALIVAGVYWLRRRRKPPQPSAVPSPMTRDQINASIAKALSEIQINEQWRANADRYGDDVRAHAREAELVELRAQLAEANAQLEEFPRGPRRGLRLTHFQVQDRLTFMNDTGGRVVVRDIDTEGSLDITLRSSPPFPVAPDGSFFVNLHRILGRTKDPQVIIRWNDDQGDEYVQRIGV